MKKKVLLLITLALCAALAFGCGNDKSAQTPAGTDGENTKIVVGVTGGPHEMIMNKVKELAKEQGLDVEVVVFSDYIQPNVQLNEGELDMNAMQHAPFLENTCQEKGYELSNIGQNILIPMCILSDKLEDLADLADGALIGLPDDTTNEARALQLLASAGLITLDENAGIMATPKDITDNPKNLKFHEMEAGLLLPTLSEFDAAVVNSNYVVEAGMTPSNDALFVEPTENNPWVNIFACRSADKDNANFQKLISIYQSDAVKAFIAETYPGDAVLAAW